VTIAHSKDEDYKDKMIARARAHRARTRRRALERLREIHREILETEEQARKARMKGQRHFGDHLRTLRLDRDMSLSELARRAGVSAGFVSDIEYGRRLPGFEVRERMIAVLENAE